MPLHTQNGVPVQGGFPYPLAPLGTLSSDVRLPATDASYGKLTGTFVIHTVRILRLSTLNCEPNSQSSGEIVYTPAFGLHICVLGGPRAILELLDKRSAITSSRHSTHINDL